MLKIYNSHFNKYSVIINPGEQYVSDDYIIQTVLGSCIAAVLYSEERQIGGMNHFLLPGEKSGIDLLHSEAGRYGQTAMDLLINALMKKGLSKRELKAKIFGGGEILIHNKGKKLENVGQRNTRFILDYLESESIPVISKDVGGFGGRKIFFVPETCKVFLTHLHKTDINTTIEQETEYLKHIKERKSKVIFFQENN